MFSVPFQGYFFQKLYDALHAWDAHFTYYSVYFDGTVIQIE